MYKSSVRMRKSIIKCFPFNSRYIFMHLFFFSAPIKPSLKVETIFVNDKPKIEKMSTFEINLKSKFLKLYQYKSFTYH